MISDSIMDGRGGGLKTLLLQSSAVREGYKDKYITCNSISLTRTLFIRTAFSFLASNGSKRFILGLFNSKAFPTLTYINAHLNCTDNYDVVKIKSEISS